eukprot:1814404-Prymnesium_polylepis.1
MSRLLLALVFLIELVVAVPIASDKPKHGALKPHGCPFANQKNMPCPHDKKRVRLNEEEDEEDDHEDHEDASGEESHDSEEESSGDHEHAILYPSQILTCPTAQHNLATGTDESLYQNIVTAVWEHFSQEGRTAQEKQDYAGCILRTAGHDFMDFRWTHDGSATGGSDGCINFHDPDNMGIPQCLERFGFAYVYHDFCAQVSLGDFFVVAAEAAMAITSPTYKPESFAMGTLAQKFMTVFSFGRPVNAECAEHDKLMPNPEEGCADLKRVFVDHVYLDSNAKMSWKHTAAISGAHTIGQTNPHNSGYNGSWTFDAGIFNNAYYLRILDQGWMPQWDVSPGKNQWIVSDKSRSKPEVAKQMMLNSD